MAITTYSELQTEVAAWLHRTDLTTNGKILDFIAIAEVDINNFLTTQPSEDEAQLTATIGSRFIALPSDYISPIELWLTYYDDRDRLNYINASNLPVDETPTTPTYWTIDGTNIALDVPADVAYTFDFRYKTKYKLTDASPTNWLLTNHPDVYLYGSLAAGARYTRDMESLVLWERSFRTSMAAAKNKERRANALNDLRVDIAMSGMASDFFRGE